MSLLIKGMKMPNHCIDCPFMISRDGDDCILQSEEANSNFENWDQMRDNCPLVEVKTPHGRLIDADAVIEKLAKAIPYIIDDDVTNAYVEGLGTAKIEIEDSVAVIEAEGE